MERRQDIQPLLHHFWQGDGNGPSYTDSAINLLKRYDWPGNVRQLRNFSARMAALKPSGMVEGHDVERFIAEQHTQATNLPVSTGRTVEEAGQELIYRAIMQLGNEIRMLRDLITSHLPSEDEREEVREGPVSRNVQMSMEDMERKLIEETLNATGGNRKEAARRLGIGERTLYRKLSKYNLS
jgi:DNA-binding NtrC family response regulator